METLFTACIFLTFAAIIYATYLLYSFSRELQEELEQRNEYIHDLLDDREAALEAGAKIAAPGNPKILDAYRELTKTCDDVTRQINEISKK